jgi:putative ABC transport system substrate-binding protein
MRRREFIVSGGAAMAPLFLWPVAAYSQQPAMPMIGYLYSGAPETSAHLTAAFRKGLDETGFAEGRNVAVEYRFAQNDDDRLADMAADLVRRRVAVIVAPGNPATALAAKAATTTIPIVFRTGTDPVQTGLVASLSRPGGNLTGINTMSGELGAKQLGLLHELLAKAERYAALISSNDAGAASFVADIGSAAKIIGRDVEVLGASTNRDIDAAFATIVHKRIDALVIGPHGLFNNRRVQLVTLASRHAVPTIYSVPEFTEIGGLMSYGASAKDQFRQAGIYTGRILKGEKPADMPVLRATKFDFVINLQTARTLGLDIPPTLLARADEVIE